MLTLWAVNNLPAFEELIKEIVPEVALSISFPKYQAGIITTQAMVCNNTLFNFLGGIEEDLNTNYTHIYIQGSKDIRSTLQKVQLAIFYQIESERVPSKVHYDNRNTFS